MIDRIGVVAHKDKPACLFAAKEAIAQIEAAGKQFRLSEETAQALGMRASAEGLDDADCLLVIGGDGTILRSARAALRLNVPILGVNYGRVGFLSEVEPEDQSSALAALMAGRGREESRLLIEAETEKDQMDRPYLALNDILLCKLHHSRTVTIEVRVDGKIAASCACDGMLVSTPTGSTAYALSAGGPIVSPELEALQVTPICPHAISARPIMLPAKAEIAIRLVQDHYNSAQVCADGELIVDSFSQDSVLKVRAARERLRFLRIGDSNYFETVRRKLFVD